MSDTPTAPSPTSGPSFPDGRMDDQWEEGIARGMEKFWAWVQAQAKQAGLTEQAFLAKIRAERR